MTGIGFVPIGSHNGDSDGAWLTPAGFDRLFRGTHYAFKFHAAAVTLRPGADVQAVARRLNAAAAAIKGGRAFTFGPAAPATEVQELKDVAVLPLALSAFLAVLAAGAVGHALSIAVRRRRHELAVLRALGLTRRQSRLVIVTQAALLAVIGLAVRYPAGRGPRPRPLAGRRQHDTAGLPPAGGTVGAAADRAAGPAGRWPAGRLARPPRGAAAHRAAPAHRVERRVKPAHRPR